MRRYLILIMTIAFFLSFCSESMALDNPITIKINGQIQKFNPSPVLSGSNILLPAEQLYKALGAKTTLSRDKRTITASIGNIELEIEDGSSTIKINGEPQYIDISACLTGETIMVSVKTAEVLGAGVTFLDNMHTVLIDSYPEEILNLFPYKENLLSPAAIACNPKTGHIYAIVGRNKTLAIIDGESGKIIDNIDLGYNDNTLFAGIFTHNCVTVDPKTNTIYVCPRDWGDTVIIDGNTNKIIRRIATKDILSACDPTTNTIYNYKEYGGRYISIIDVNKGTEIEKITPAVKYPVDMAFNSSNSHIYLTDDEKVLIIDVKTKKTEKTVYFDNRIDRIAIDSKNSKVYLVDCFSCIHCIDGNTGNELGRIKFPDNSYIKDIAVDSSSSRLYVAACNRIISVDTDSMTLVNELPSRYYIGDGSLLAFDDVKNQLYLTTPDKASIQVYIAKGGKLESSDSICLGSSPIDVAVNPETQRLYAADKATDSVVVFDMIKKQVIRRIAVDGEPTAIAAGVARDEVYYVCSTGLYYIDGKANKITGRTELSGKPQKMSIDQTNNRIYITDNAPQDGSIHVIDILSREQISQIDSVFPQGIAANTRKNKFYIGLLGGGKVSPIITGMEIIPSGVRETISGFRQEGQALGGEMRVYEGAGFKMISDFYLPDYAYGAPVIYDESQDKIFVAINYDGYYLVAVDCTNDQMVEQLKVSKELRIRAINGGGSIFKDMAVDAINGRLFISIQNDGVFVLDSHTLDCISVISLAKGSTPLGIEFTKKDGRLYTANSGDGTISVLE